MEKVQVAPSQPFKMTWKGEAPSTTRPSQEINYLCSFWMGQFLTQF